jgi:ketopantoate reductase
LAEKIERGRAGKKKELDEIDYYNGAVLKMAKKLKVEVPINSKIWERIKK